MKSKGMRAILLVSAIGLACGCRGTEPALDYAAFQEAARTSDFGDIRNDLYAIDDRLVFWALECNCMDMAYSYRLCGTSPEEPLCVLSDSIGGPQEYCFDESYRELFETILANLDRPDLGLSPGHCVREIDY